jgi:hypothetical protein
MTHRLICCVFLTLTLTLSAAAQGKKPAGGSTGSTAPSTNRSSTQPSMNNPDTTLGGQKALIFGKVVLDDGSPIPEAASIQTICHTRKQTVTHTDSHGGFSFELGDRMGAVAAGISSADVDSAGSGLGPDGGGQKDYRSCEILASLPGFTSQTVDLSSRLSTFESTDIGTLVLHRMGGVQGFTVSATTAAAPKDAQKAYEKGREKAGKEKWDEAQQLLTKAVEIYPRYAVAWFDLGRVQLHNKDAVQARHSFEQSIAADAKYTSPYRGLAELEAQQKQWQPLVTVTGQLLALDPVSFPDAWLRNALGNYYLSNFPAAEKSARQGMRIDDQHQVPKLEYLLGLILAHERNYDEATLHIQNYLKFTTQPADIADAQKQLAEITRLSASVNPTAPAPGEKK